jgi:hypothetical protein
MGARDWSQVVNDLNSPQGSSQRRRARDLVSLEAQRRLDASGAFVDVKELAEEFASIMTKFGFGRREAFTIFFSP